MLPVMPFVGKNESLCLIPDRSQLVWINNASQCNVNGTTLVTGWRVGNGVRMGLFSLPRSSGKTARPFTYQYKTPLFY